MGCIDLPNPTQGSSLEGAGQERLGLVLYKTIKYMLNLFNSMATCVFDESLARRQKMVAETASIVADRRPNNTNRLITYY
jgi:hypothetical protein